MTHRSIFPSQYSSTIVIFNLSKKIPPRGPIEFFLHQFSSFRRANTQTNIFLRDPFSDPRS